MSKFFTLLSCRVAFFFRIFAPMKQNSVTPSELIGQLRLPLVILVTYAHSYGAVDPDYSLLTSEWDSYEVLKLLVSQTLVKVVVPVFFMISGYLFFNNVERWNLHVYGEKLKRRLWTLFLPYVVWNILMAVKLNHLNSSFLFSPSSIWSQWEKAGIQTDWLGMEHWMTAPCNMPLWFLRDLMVVSLLSPLVYWLIRHWGRWVIAVLTVVYLSGIGAFPLPGLSMYAVYFFSLGAFLSIHRHDPIAVALRFEKPASVLSLLLAGAMMLTYRTPLFSPLMLGFRLTGAVVVVCLAYRLLTNTRHRQSAVVCRSSYFLYLGHYVFFLSFIDAWMLSIPHSTLLFCVHYLAAPLLKAVLFVLAYQLWNRLWTMFFSVKK